MVELYTCMDSSSIFKNGDSYVSVYIDTSNLWPNDKSHWLFQGAETSRGVVFGGN